MTRLSLVQCPVWGVDDPPLGVAVLAGCAEQCGQPAQIFDLNVRLWHDVPPERRAYWSWNRLPLWNDRYFVRGFFEEAHAALCRYTEEILAADPQAVAFSVSLGTQWSSLAVAELVKRRNPAVTVMMGGPFFANSANREAFIRETAVDMIVNGAGDDVFVKLLGLYQACGRWMALPGVTLKTAEGVAQGPKAIPYTFDLDLAPRPDFSGFSFDLYARPKQMPMSASRGCGSKCYFCSSREYWGKYSFKSGDKIFSEVVEFDSRHPGLEHVEFYDINANGNVASLTRFSEMIADHGANGRRVTWRINASVKPEMTRDALRQMARGGCAEIVYGVESGSPATLKRMNKDLTPSEAHRVLRETRDAGIRTTACFIVGAPGETEEDFRESLDFVEAVRGSLDRVSVAPFELEEAGYMTRHAAGFGLRETALADGRDPDWTTIDGSSTPDQRRARWKRFRDKCVDLGIPLDERPVTIGPMDDVNFNN